MKRTYSERHKLPQQQQQQQQSSGTVSGARSDNLRRLATHPLNARLRVAPSGLLQQQTCGINGKEKWTTIPGLVDRLRECFYPEYDYRLAKNAARRQKWRPNWTPAPADPRFVAQRKKLKLEGRELGQFIDKEFGGIVEHIVKRALPMIPASLGRLPPVSLFTKSLLEFHIRNRWQPLFVQFNVFAPDLNVGTRIDEICMDKERRLIVVEHKYGYDTYREFGNATMSAPLEDCLNSPQHQHVLQCGIPALMLQKYYNVQVHGGFTVYITDGEVHPVPLPAWFWARADAIWAAFEQRLKKRI